MIMPEIDGLMLLRWFRSHPATYNIPIVMLSSKEDPQTKADAFVAGANDYLIKLPDVVELIARIRYHSKAYNNLKALSTANATSHRLKQEIEVIKEYGDLPLVECYPAQLNQVFMNILSNAIDALLEQEQKKQKQIVIKTKKTDSGKITISIRDNGPGISLELQSKIFDPFFTTKPVNKGTGIGLAISYQIIEKHQGNIYVCSDPSYGTEFIIEIPTEQIT